MAIGRLHHVVIDTPEPAGLARFYSALLDLPIVYESEDWVVVSADDRRPGIAFQLAPDHEAPDWPDPARPQQCHLAVMVDDLAVSGAAVQALGASRLNPGVTRPLIFADPSGHPFCSLRDRDGRPRSAKRLLDNDAAHLLGRDVLPATDLGFSLDDLLANGACIQPHEAGDTELMLKSGIRSVGIAARVK